MKYKHSDVRVPIDNDNLSICRNEEKCILCGACKNICQYNVAVYGNYDLNKNKKAICINCGQCSLACPTSSICEKYDYINLKEVMKSNKIKIFQTAPAVRVTLGEEFDYPLGTNVQGKLITALKMLGADYVFDTTFGADLTIMEEANELVDRLKQNKKLPMFTSCCPAWVKYVETFYPEYIDNLSTCKSPILMQGAIIKSYFASKKNLNKNDIISIAVTPCTAKKYEIKRKEFNNDVDYVITTRELARWLKEEKIDLKNLNDSKFDDLMQMGTGAGVIFGASGGVMESAMRCVNHILGGKKEIKTFPSLRGLGNIKEMTIEINNKNINVAVINGTGDAKKVLEKLKTGEANYDFIEVMACEGGCIAGGGTPKVNFPVTGEVKQKRKEGLFNIDENLKIRNSYENEDIINIYKDFLEHPLSKTAEKLLHTSYINRSADLKVVRQKRKKLLHKKKKKYVK